MNKGRIAILVVLVVGLLVTLNFLSWTNPNVVKESPKMSPTLSSSFFTYLSPLLAGIVIVGIVTLWIIVVNK